MCCACDGSCNHVGPHSWCGFHGGAELRQLTIPMPSQPASCASHPLASQSGCVGCLDEVRQQMIEARKDAARLATALEGFWDGECHCDESDAKKPCVTCVAGRALTSHRKMLRER